ncbi:MAG: metal-dependent hydrolase [Beijerinckiaceae bacterium]
MQITWYGHSNFRLDFGGHAVLIDPFFTGNPVFTGDRKAATKGVTHVLISHGHGDHVGDALAIAAENDATVVTNYDLCMWLAAQGLKKFEPMNTGGTVECGGFSVTLVRADHSAAQVEGGVNFPLGNANGIIVKAKGEPTIWHCGDTDIFSDMKLICQIHKPKVALVPIGDRFTMGAATAALAVKKFMPGVSTVIPCHYGAFVPFTAPDAKPFLRAVKGAKAKVLVPALGQATAVK